MIIPCLSHSYFGFPPSLLAHHKNRDRVKCQLNIKQSIWFGSTSASFMAEFSKFYSILRSCYLVGLRLVDFIRPPQRENTESSSSDWFVIGVFKFSSGFFCSRFSFGGFDYCAVFICRVEECVYIYPALHNVNLNFIAVLEFVLCELD